MSDKLIFEPTSGLTPLPDSVSVCTTTMDKHRQVYEFAISVEAGGITSDCAFVMVGEQAEMLKQAILFLTHEVLRRKNKDERCSWLLVEYDRQHEGPAGKARKLIEDAPAAPHEMTAREFVKHYARMCHTINRCTQCPIFAEATKENPIKSCWFWVRDNAEKAVSIVEAWAAEHPERSEDNVGL